MRNKNFDSTKFSSVEEDDTLARSAVSKFNELRSSVLTRQLVEVGFSLGDSYRAKTFATRIVQTSQGKNQPVVFFVFGNSFTIGSNCGESSAQNSGECAWPGRLRKRWMGVVTPGLCKIGTGNYCKVEWHMMQENAQGSVNIAQKIPAILCEFSSKNTTPDAIFLDSSQSDPHNNRKPWFEAIVRVFTKSYPAALIVSLINGSPDLLMPVEFVEHAHKVQKHYGLATVDIAKMVKVLQQNNSVDLLWPQASSMALSNGTEIMGDPADNYARPNSPVFWANFLPKVHKTKYAYYPQNHPPWITHQ
jgi:hypothetical protein